MVNGDLIRRYRVLHHVSRGGYNAARYGVLTGFSLLSRSARASNPAMGSLCELKKDAFIYKAQARAREF